MKRWGFYFGNTIYQLFPSFLFTGLLPYLAFPLIVLNVAILVTLREKKARTVQGAPYPQQPMPATP